MEHARPSRTALRVAMRRAAHQLYDVRPLVFEDPLAISILGSHASELERTPGRSLLNKPRPFSLSLRAFLVARSRYAEDLLAQAVANGATQYVLLGAGLDTFAHRNPNPSLRVFEVDHPATQQWKQELLTSARLANPANLTYVPVDFEHQSLATQMRDAGFDSAVPSFFAWLGVVSYLSPRAFQDTLHLITQQAAGSGVVFDYSQPRFVLSPSEQLEHDSLVARVQLAGEPIQLFFTPSQVAAELSSFHKIEDFGAAEINAKYFRTRGDNLKVLGTASRIVSASL